MGKLYRRKGSPYLWAWWYDEEGQRRRESTDSSDRRVATLFLSAKEAETIRRGAGLPVARRVALATALAEYLTAHAPPIWSARWHYTIKHWARARLIPELGGPDTDVSAITRATVEAARTAWLREVSPQTVNRLCTAGSGFFRWATDPARQYALENPFSRHKRFPETKVTPPPLSEFDLTAFLASVPNPVIRRAATLALDTGLRFSEVRRLRGGDAQGRLLHVVSSYARGLTKNRRERWLVLSPRAGEAVQAQREAAGDALFAGMPVNIRRSLHAAQKRAGLPRFRWHDLRHYALTRAAQAGVLAHDLRGMAGWVGDESARYIHPEAAGMQPFIEALGGECARVVPGAGAGPRIPEDSRGEAERLTPRNPSMPPDSGSGYQGSNPCPPANFRRKRGVV